MVLQAEGITKLFGGVVAVQGVDIHVEKGAFVGLVGPNGAGKSTVLSIICGAQNADGGRVLICGADVCTHPTQAREKLFFVPDRPGLYPYLSCYDFLAYLAKLHKKDAKKIPHYAAKTGCVHLLGHAMGGLSRGQRQAVYLAAAFLAEPALMVLDEPTVGLDPLQQKNILAALGDFCRKGGAVLLSTHSLYEAESVCDTLYVLMHKKIIAKGPAATISHGHHNLFDFFSENAKEAEKCLHQ